MVWMKDEQWDNVIKTNLDSFFYVTRLVLNNMLVKRYGRIINVVSLSGLKGLAGPDQLFGCKSGRDRGYQGVGTGNWPPRHYGKCCCAGVY